MNSLFNIQDLNKELKDNKCFADSFENEMTFKVKSLKQLLGRLPDDNEIFFIETQKSFTAFTFIVHVLKTAKHIHHLYIATYSTNDRILNALMRYKNQGQIDSVHIHISETIKFRMPEIYNRLLQLADDNSIELSFAWSHKKVTCMDTDLGCFVVEGSGNYGENALEEQYIFLKSKKIYEFRCNKKPL